MGQKHSGSCLCGAARFEITGAFDGFFLCHCSRCRKGSGSAHASNLFSSNAELNWIAGAEKVRAFQVEGTRHKRAFCTECGSVMPRVHEALALLVVPAGSLDSEVPMRPNAHICCASKASWDDKLEEVPKFDGLPG